MTETTDIVETVDVAQPPVQPPHPSLDPALVHETNFAALPLAVPGQPVIVDPGDANPLPHPDVQPSIYPPHDPRAGGDR